MHSRKQNYQPGGSTVTQAMQRRLVVLSLSSPPPLFMSRVTAVSDEGLLSQMFTFIPLCLTRSKIICVFSKYRFVSAPSPLPMLEMLLRLAIHPAVFLYFCPLHRSHSLDPLQGLLILLLLFILILVPVIHLFYLLADTPPQPTIPILVRRSVTGLYGGTCDLAIGFGPSLEARLRRRVRYIYDVGGGESGGMVARVRVR